LAYRIGGGNRPAMIQIKLPVGMPVPPCPSGGGGPCASGRDGAQVRDAMR
jgi:hypothetical protein